MENYYFQLALVYLISAISAVLFITSSLIMKKKKVTKIILWPVSLLAFLSTISAAAALGCLEEGFFSVIVYMLHVVALGLSIGAFAIIIEGSEKHYEMLKKIIFIHISLVILSVMIFLFFII